MTNKVLAYAEDKLGVHRVWTDTEALVNQLRDLYRTQADLETESRTLNMKIDQKKHDLLINEWNQDECRAMTATAFERHMKIVIAGSEDLRTLIELLNNSMAQRDAIGAQIRDVENNHKGHVARMNELGGYFEYLSAAKNAAVVGAQAVADYPW